MGFPTRVSPFGCWSYGPGDKHDRSFDEDLKRLQFAMSRSSGDKGRTGRQTSLDSFPYIIHGWCPPTSSMIRMCPSHRDDPSLTAATEDFHRACANQPPPPVFGSKSAPILDDTAIVPASCEKRRVPLNGFHVEHRCC